MRTSVSASVTPSAPIRSFASCRPPTATAGSPAPTSTTGPPTSPPTSREYHPQVVTILIGGNDAQSFEVNNESVEFESAQWHTIYSQRVALMMSETLKAGAKMLWVGLPIMENPVFGASMQTLNAIYKAQAALHPGVEFLPTWALFSNAAGQYSAELTNSSGQTVLARDPDGVHIAPPGGCDIVAVAATKSIEKTWHVKLGA